jgi:hypothetical protein
MQHKFKTAAVTISEGIVTAIFNDGTVNEFNTHWLDRPEYRQIALEHGFGDDWRFYAYTHEITHHWVADRLGWEWSWAVHDNVHYEMDKMPAHIAWEEHLVNKLQRFIMTGKPDEHGVLYAVLGNLSQGDHIELGLLYASLK